MLTHCFATSIHRTIKGGVVYRQKIGGGGGGGGRKRAVSAQCEVRLKMATAGLKQILRSCAWRLSRITKFVFFSNVAPKLRKRGKCTKTKQKATRIRLVKTQEATRGRLVYHDDAEDDWTSRCRRRENMSRRQAKNFNRFESHTQHLSNEDKSG